MIRTCDETGCDDKHFGLGLCSKHYNRMAYLRKKDPDAWARFQEELKQAAREAEERRARPDKICSKCERLQPKTEFSTMPKMKDGLHSWCKACLRNLAKKNYDPERARVKHVEKKVDPDYIAMKKSAYDRWRTEHPDRARSATVAWRSANHERVRNVRIAWIVANRERWALLRRQNSKLRKLRKKKQTVGHVNYVKILERDGMVCHICRTEIPGLDDLHFDHVIPLSRGGEHSMANVKPAHAACNLRKNDKLMEELTWLTSI